ncbi:MAG TPA: hypothetical protein VGS07_25960 [Thermoanaerobaculia bacterium]|jgi:hypothetical protein|nr:hypothetical protein [Thermoanaerobaculia bacterium]
MNISSFMGTWPINFTTGPLSQPGKALENLGSIEIGTGDNGATAPFLCDTDYELKIGFALLDTSGTVIFSSDSGPLLSLVGEQLRWHGPYEGRELNINIALAEVFRDHDIDRGFYSYLFGCTVYGDPDQVGVWGGSGMGGSGVGGGGTPKVPGGS